MHDSFSFEDEYHRSRELGFEVSFQICKTLRPEHQKRVYCEFVEEAIEANCLSFAGAGSDGQWIGIVYSSAKADSEAARFQKAAVVDWLNRHPFVTKVCANSSFNLWYDDESSLKTRSEREGPQNARPDRTRT